MAALPHRARWRPGASMFLSVVLIALFALALGRQIVVGHLTNTDEIITAERARELRFSGPGAIWDNFEPVFHKPPLQYWLTALTLSLWPEHLETAVRLPTLLYAVGTAGLVVALARAVAPELAGGGAPLAVGIFVMCPLVLVEGSRALLDMGLTFWTTLVLLAAQRAWGRPGWWLWAGGAAACGSLQKVPLPAGALVVVVGLRLLSPEGRAGLRAGRALLVAGLGLAVAGTAVWPLLQAGLHGMPARWAFSLGEAGSLRGDTRLGARSAWEVPARLTLRWSWGLFALAAAGRVVFVRVRDWRREVVSPAGEVAAVCLGIVLVATVGGFRSVRYVLPAVPGLCVLAALAVTEFGLGPGWRRPGAAALAAGLFALGLPTVWHHVRTPRSADSGQHPLAVALGGWRRPGETVVLVREPEDQERPDGVLPDRFYLFYGNLNRPVRSIRIAELGALEIPPAGVLGVCRATDFPGVGERLPGAEVRLVHGPLVLWRAGGETVDQR